MVESYYRNTHKKRGERKLGGFPYLSLFLSLFFLCFCGVLATPVGSPINHVKHEDIRAYWTPERMASARAPKGPDYNFNASQFNATENMPKSTGPATTTKGYPGDDYQIYSGENNTMLGYPFPFTSAYSPSYTTYPWRAVGKLFYTSNGQNWVCSGGVANTYFLLTAAHCVYDLTVNTWTQNVMFVPGYNNGVQPYGAYYSWQQWTVNAWINSPAATPARGYDFGIVILWQKNGQGIGPVVGWFGVAWNWGYQLSWRALGYPSQAPFTGQVNYYCDAALGTIDTNYNPNTPGIGCDTTPGCSGGPWVKDFATNPAINTVFGYYYFAQPNGWYGAYFGDHLASLYQTCSAITPGSS